MIRVQTASRLHFGCFGLPGADRWPNLDGELVLAARWFGGVGLMIDEPGIRLAVTPARDWSADGPLAERALAFARCFAGQLPAEAVHPLRLHVEHAPPDHVGLGTGTQLALAVSKALLAAYTLPEMDAHAIAQKLGRGQRSAVGIHGFQHGGFVVEGGKTNLEEIAPLLLQLPFPPEWRMVLVVPEMAKGLSGPEERESFARLQNQPTRLDWTEAQCRTVLLGMVPALRTRDFQGFAEALFDFNARTGAMFAAIQKGRYGSPAVSELVSLGRRLGFRGAGQSSWGPAIFFLAEDEAAAQRLLRDLSGSGGSCRMWISAAGRPAVAMRL